jgi:hypothetical protein
VTEALANTFLRPYKPVAGMATLYQNWSSVLTRRAGGGPTPFHYLSGSPSQLYPELNSFVTSSGYPAGPLELQNVELTSVDSIQSAVNISAHKVQVLNTLFDNFPQKKYILLGDSTQSDPEVPSVVPVLRREPTPTDFSLRAVCLLFMFRIQVYGQMTRQNQSLVHCIFIRKVMGVDWVKEGSLNNSTRLGFGSSGAFHDVDPKMVYVFVDASELQSIDIVNGCQPPDSLRSSISALHHRAQVDGNAQGQWILPFNNVTIS